MSANVIVKVCEALKLGELAASTLEAHSDVNKIRAALVLLDRVEVVEGWVERGKPGVPIADVIHADFKHDGYSCIYAEPFTEAEPALLLLAPTEENR